LWLQPTTGDHVRLIEEYILDFFSVISFPRYN